MERRTRSEPLGQLLIRQGLIKDFDLESALRHQERTGKRLSQALVELGLVSEESMLTTLSDQFGTPIIRFDDFPDEPYKDERLSANFLKQYKLFPLSLNGDTLELAMMDPLDLFTIDNLENSFGFVLDIKLCSETDLDKAIQEYYLADNEMDQIVDTIEEDEYTVSFEDEDIDHLRDMASEAPVIKLVNLIITRAVERGASDIHLEPFEHDFRVRYRVDGILHEQDAPPRRLQAAVISRVKIMAEMNIAERRLPQDGRIRMNIIGRKIDLRVSTIPTLYGESVVMRILDRASFLLTLEDLGFGDHDLQIFNKIIEKPHGIVLITGPTGSGKTTTLYAALDKINRPDSKIITIEEPVEYQLHGVNQIQVKSSIGLTFANGLRSIVRQDPDVIMVGEIRDLETADISINASLTGHLVFSTVHTNDAPGAITRLLDMGVEPFLVSSCLEGIMAQRLIRVICPDCKEENTDIEPDIMKEIESVSRRTGTGEGRVTSFRGRGCPECNNTGYRGRKGLFELMDINEGIRSLILQKVNTAIIKTKARERGMRTLREDGWRQVLGGVTSIEEVLRVTIQEEEQGA